LENVAEIRFVNLTQHPIAVYTGQDIVTHPTTGMVARLMTKQIVVGHINDVPIIRTEWGDIIGLPEPEEGVIYITSSIVANAAQRRDVVSPCTSPQFGVRDENGYVIGTRAFQCFIKGDRFDTRQTD
jgi:hypothetical protein